MKITEQFILLQAPNSSAAVNGRKLSNSGSFRAHGKNAEGTVFWAECMGSGNYPYITSLDFSQSETTPTCRCSCPSRQFPCKHALGLMYELLAGRDFPIDEIPGYVAEKIRKQAAKTEKKEAKAATEKAKKPNVSAQKKKLSKQLGGIALARKLVDDLLTGSISTLAGTSAQTFEKVAKDLGNYYLTGPQNAFTRMALAVRKIQQTPERAEEAYAEALQTLISLHATLKKGEAYLNQKLESGNVSAEDSVLYEAMGGIWRLEDLKAIGAFQENTELVQLSFDVSLDEAKKEYVERGFWVNPDRGTLCQTLNYRPLKALKYVKADDSCFETVQIPVLYEYPGELNRRVRWEGCTTRPVTTDDLRRILDAASCVADAAKSAKNQMKNTLMPKFIPALIRAEHLGSIGENLILTDPDGNRLMLRDRQEEGRDHACTHRLKALPLEIPAGSAVFGLMFYDNADHRICLHPYSIVTPDVIIRLLY